MNINRLQQLAGIVTEGKFDQVAYEAEKAESMNEVREILTKLNFKLSKASTKDPVLGINADYKESDPYISCDLVKTVIKELIKKGWKNGIGDNSDLSFQLVKKGKNIGCYVQVMPGRKGVNVYAEEI